MKALYQFCGLGGGALGFQRAGFESVGAFDNDPAAVADFELLTGEKATVADLMTLQPHEMAALCSGRPDVVFTSPPCKGFSGCLPTAVSKTDKYQGLNSLAQRGMWLALEAWEKPPALIILENVPRIMSRGREWLDAIGSMLRAYGYAVKETTHDCGELGGLAQHRRRFLLVARHIEQVPEFLYEPPVKRVRGIGEVLGELPVPLPGEPTAGVMHRLPKLSAMNWVRLALIHAGKDWRDLPPSVELHTRSARQNGGYGVEDWDRPSHSVIAEGSVRNTRASVADPRVASEPRSGVYGVASGADPSSTVTGAASHDNGAWSVSDPRVENDRREGGHGVKGWDEASTPVISAASIHNWPATAADPRVKDGGRYRGSYGVQDGAQPSATIRGAHEPRLAPSSLADPRLTKSANRHAGKYGLEGWRMAARTVLATSQVTTSASALSDPRLTHATRRGTMGVHGWAEPSHVIIGDARAHKGNSVADPRVPGVYGPAFDIDDKRPQWLVIRAADGTWHRPMTTLELAALQGFPVIHNGEWLQLTGKSHAAWRGRIGNAVPPPAAEAIARACAATLKAAGESRFLLSGQPVWVGGVNHLTLEAQNGL